MSAPEHDETPIARPRRGIRKSVYIIPSLFTTANIFCGFYSLIQQFHGALAVHDGDAVTAASHFDVAAIAIGWAVLFDFLDGRVARMTNSTTQFGVEFDSIADVLTFGIAPSMLAYSWGYGFIPEFGRIPLIVSFMYLICGALRLARFNVQASKPALQKPGASPKIDKKAFVGMPIPAGASLIAAIVHFWPTPVTHTKTTLRLFDSPVTISGFEWAVLLLFLVAALGVLMVSTIRHTSFKTVGPRQRNPRMVIILIALVVASVWFYSRWTLLIIATAYATHGVVGKLLGIIRPRSHGQPHPDVAVD